MTFSRIHKLIRDDLRFLRLKGYDLYLSIKEGAIEEFPRERDFAYYNGDEITVSPRLKEQAYPRVIGIIRHEIGHALLIDDPDHSEQQADDIIEECFGHRIYYDDQDIQTILPLHYPRPRNIHQ